MHKIVEKVFALLLITIIIGGLTVVAKLLKTPPKEKVYCEWEIVYPDTTITYKDTLVIQPRLNASSEEREIGLIVGSSKGSNYIHCPYGRIESKCTTESTCPIRIIK